MRDSTQEWCPPELISIDHIDSQAQDAYENFQEADSVFMSHDVYIAFEKMLMQNMRYSNGTIPIAQPILRVITSVGELIVKRVPQLTCFCYVGTEKSLQQLEWIKVGQAFEKEIFGVDT